MSITIGLYEEFPNPWRLAKLDLVDFPVTLAVAATTRAEFFALRAGIQQTYPHVQDVYFWPLLAREEGYYPGTWSSAAAIQRVAIEAADLPVLWDLELPRSLPFVRDWRRNRAFLDRWLRERRTPVHLWRSHTRLGLDSRVLRLAGMHFDPRDYPAVALHIDLYTTGAGQRADALTRLLHEGVTRYGARFVPSFGVLNDGEGSPRAFVPPATFRRNLQLARAAGVGELWVFGVNGLNAEYVAALRELQTKN